MNVTGASYSTTGPLNRNSIETTLTHSSHVYSETKVPKENVTCIQKFITNWLIMDPSLVEETTKPIRNYQIQKHEHMKYVYFMGGRFRTIKTKPITILTGIAILVPGILFWIFESSWVWHNIHPSIVILFSYIWWLSFMFYFKSSSSDPGILPRNIHIPTSLIDNNRVNYPPEEYFNTISLPGYHDKVQVKYCSTCHVWRPPRTSHCNICQVCILSHDHHCVYLNNCIGERNYRYFLWFLIFTVLACVFLLVITLVHLFHYRFRNEITSFGQSIKKYPVALLLFIYSILGGMYPLLLLFFHIFLNSQNITTREYLNYVYKRKNNNYVNVFDTHNLFKNLYINWLGKSKGVALVRPRDKYQPGDMRFEKVKPLELFSKESI